MTEDARIGLTQEVWIDAPPESVFDYFVDADRWQAWQAGAAEVDARTGGGFRATIAGTSVASGTFLEIIRPSRLVMTWGWEGHDLLPPGSSIVEIDFVAENLGTRVRLSHTGLPTEERDNMAEGWAHYLSRLQVAARGSDPGPDPWAGP